MYYYFMALNSLRCPQLFKLIRVRTDVKILAFLNTFLLVFIQYFSAAQVRLGDLA